MKYHRFQNEKKTHGCKNHPSNLKNQSHKSPLSLTTSLAVTAGESSGYTLACGDPSNQNGPFFYFCRHMSQDHQNEKANTQITCSSYLMISSCHTPSQSNSYFPTGAAGGSLPAAGGGSASCLLSVLDRSSPSPRPLS